MKKQSSRRGALCQILVCAVLFAGCAGREDGYREAGEEKASTAMVSEDPGTERREAGAQSGTEEHGISDGTETAGMTGPTEDKIVEADWADYFQGQNGAAVIYDPAAGQYTIWQEETACTRRSPCSTFKVISSLIALEHGVIGPEDSTRAWSGEVFWNEDWNRDIDFTEAFRTSCVWYYRQVIDEIGAEVMQSELERLQYGNCDISDWEGRLNTNNGNRALTGFWLESSLLISPKEQAEVMERIFGGHSEYSEASLKELKRVMLLTGQETADGPIYGKTGTGMADGVVVDAWFAGFAERAEGNLYFCVYLGRTDGAEVSGSRAKDIAVAILSEL